MQLLLLLLMPLFAVAWCRMFQGATPEEEGVKFM